ncbi:DUF5934 domain-containing protein [Novosphingobium sp.]|uniref:conjugal transfer protein TraH n=1 Tax=Novosphingobium sp. TaxID=1874826 RepID=UPI0038BBCEE9
MGSALSQTKSARFLPKLADQSAEWRHVQNELQAGKKLVKLFYGLTSYSPLGSGDAHERVIKAIFKAAGWDLTDERFLQLQGLVAAFPLSLADGLADDMLRLKRMRTMLSTTAANIAPMQGEYLGRTVPHLLLVGRRGQPFWWSPFENGAGNHNIAICGKSGSGKSVLLQELCAALRGAGAKVVVIDDGRSFEHSVKLQGGRFVEFTLAAGFSLNPFSMVDDARAQADEDYRLDCFAMIKAIIGQMARHDDKPSDTERGLIDRAVTTVWDTLGSGGSIDDIAGALEQGGGELGVNLATAIAPYCRGGSYGGFFSGQASSTNSGAGANYADVNPAVARNYTWHVLKKSAFFSPNGTFDRDLAEYAMTLIGTVIYVPPKDEEPGKFVPFAGDASSTLVTALLDGTQGQTVRVFACDEPDQCLNPAFRDMSLSSAQAIRPRVAALIGSMVAAIRSDTAIGDAEKELLQVASVPLYKILTVQAAYGRGMATDDRDTLAEITSIDLLYAVLDRIVSEAGRSMASFIAADEAKLAIWRAQVAEVRSSLAQRQATGQAKVSAIMQIIEKTAMIENMLAASMSPSMAASLDWSRALQSRSIVP